MRRGTYNQKNLKEILRPPMNADHNQLSSQFLDTLTPSGTHLFSITYTKHEKKSFCSQIRFTPDSNIFSESTQPLTVAPPFPPPIQGL